MGIQKLGISGFKSIDNVELTDLPNYCVFAGANGAGKTNFFDAMRFASMVIDDGADKAVRFFGGINSIRSIKRLTESSPFFHFTCKCQAPHMSARLTVSEKNDGYSTGQKFQGGTTSLRKINGEYFFEDFLYAPKDSNKVFFFENFRVFRIDPFRAKEPDELGADPSFLDSYGRNLATVLEGIQKNQDDFETVMEWMSMIVPGLVEIETYRHPLDGRASMAFRESGTDYRFPPLLISDGTVYVLCLLAAVLTRVKQPGITMIEEPERGIHPSAIEQLSEFFRAHASDEHQIFISTHNESFVRNAKPEELFFAVKKEGRTEFRLGRDAAKAVEGMPNDKAWLQNLFDGGLPW